MGKVTAPSSDAAPAFPGLGGLLQALGTAFANVPSVNAAGRWWVGWSYSECLLSLH